MDAGSYTRTSARRARTGTFFGVSEIGKTNRLAALVSSSTKNGVRHCLWDGAASIRALVLCHPLERSHANDLAVSETQVFQELQVSCGSNTPISTPPPPVPCRPDPFVSKP